MMALNNFASTFLYAGSLILIAGIISLTILQSKLVGRLNKSLFTFLSVMFYPSNELTNPEKKLKATGNLLTLIGAIVIVFAGLCFWFSS
jgi:drug/metabolite transporter superfamily protein YnfA